MYFVSLIIPTYRREEELVNTIKYALNQNYKDYEIIVVDQTISHSGDTIDFLNKVSNKIKYIFSDIANLPYARNLGIKNSTGDIIIFVDDDVLFDNNFISNHVANYLKGYDSVQGRVIEINSCISKKSPWLKNNIKFIGSNNCLKSSLTNIITGCNFSISRKVVEKIGYFDENFKGISLREDSDYGYRIYKNNFKINFDPISCLNHLRFDKGGCSVEQNIFFSKSYYDCEIYFSKKHFHKIIQLLYLVRLFLRGMKALKILILSSYKNIKLQN